MTQSLWLYGYAPPDEKWEQMAKIYFACKDAKIDPPPEVEKYFEDGEPDPQGQETSLKHLAREYSAPMHWGLEIDLDKIPKNIRTIRFYVSY